mgnify:CR=1 FL=1
MAKLGAGAGWSGNYCEDLTATKSLSPSDSGKVFFLNATTEFTTTLPSVADAGAGWNCKFIVKAAPSSADYVISEKASSDTNVIIVNGINELETDDTEDGVYNAGCTFINFKDGVSVAGDWVELLCDGTNWYATGQTNADGGVTAT